MSLDPVGAGAVGVVGVVGVVVVFGTVVDTVVAASDGPVETFATVLPTDFPIDPNEIFFALTFRPFDPCGYFI